MLTQALVGRKRYQLFSYKYLSTQCPQRNVLEQRRKPSPELVGLAKATPDSVTPAGQGIPNPQGLPRLRRLPVKGHTAKSDRSMG